MGGKTGTTTQQSTVSIPPEVLARYNAVNARAETTAQQPFTPYGGEFVAPLTGTQQAAISNINQAQGISGPYYDAAGQAMTAGYQSAQPYYGAATSSMMGGQQNANILQGEASQGINQAYYGAQPYQQAATYGLGQAYYGAQPYQEAATQNVGQAYAGAQPYQQAATSGIGQAYAGAQPYQQAATYGVGQAYAGAQPYQSAATLGLGQAYAGAQPYQETATGLGLASAAAINPESLTGQNINQYMSPYIQNVVGSTMANLRQQQQQEQSQLLGNQITSGAFGGDRGRIAQANLARQQELASGQTLAGLMNQGYGQALQTAQQQQGVQLSAEQANRAALASAGQQLGALGQQGFGQGVTTAQQLAALGQQGFGQGMTSAQQLAALGQQGFGQGMTAAQQLAALGQQGFGQGITTAQQQAALGQQGFGQGVTTAQQLAALGQQGFGQGMTAAQQQAALGQQAFAQGAQGAQTYQGLGQGLASLGQEYGKNVAGLGAQAQQSALQGAQAQLGAGTVEQQTQQALNTANYNQFLQQQGYPFQIAQFLANIAMGTGALSGSTTNAATTSPQSFFSDRRLKDDIEKIGKTFDGQDIVRYKYKGEPGTRIGLIAQDVEKHNPDAVGSSDGYRTVDYDKATDKAAERGHFASGGLAGYSSEGGAVTPEMAGLGFAQGGAPDINSMLGEILNAHQGMYPYGKAGLYGQSGGRAGAYGTEHMQTPSRGLMRAELVRASEQPGAGGQAMQGLNAARGIGSAYTEGSSALFGSAPTRGNPEGTRGLFGNAGDPSLSQGRIGRALSREEAPARPTESSAPSAETPVADAAPADGGSDYEIGGSGGDFYTGGLVRGHYAMGGLPFSEAGGYIPESVLKDDETEKNKKAMQGLSAGTAPGGGQSGSGGGLLGTIGQIGGAIKGAETIGSAASSAGEGISSLMAMLPMLALRDGGAVPRHGYALDGEVSANQEGMAGLAGLEGGLGRANDNSLEVERIVNSLGAIESGRRGDYGALGTEVRRAGREPDRAHGRYQVMGENIGPWTEQAIGRRLTPQEFLADPNAQDAVVRQQVQQNLSRYGNPQDVASVWFSGRPVAQAGESRDANNVAVPEYLRRFQSAYNAYTPGAGLGAAQPIPATQSAPNLNADGGGGLGEAQSAPSGGRRSALTDYQSAARLDVTPERREAPNWMQRNQDWLVPLLSGVGTMAASPSRYLGAALLQGIGGGAQQYAAMQQRGEEQQRQREQLNISRVGAVTTAGQLDVSRAQEERSREALAAAISAGSYNADSNTFRVYDRNGRPTLVRASEFYRAIREGRPYPVTASGAAGSTAQTNEPAAPSPRITGEALPPSVPPAAPATSSGAQPPEIGTVEQPTAPPPAAGQRQTIPAPIYREIPPDLQSRLQTIARRIEETPRTMTTPPREGEDPYPAAAEGARIAQDSTQQRNSLASELASLPTSGLFTPGAMQPAVASTVGMINSALSSVGSRVQILPQELGTTEGANKISRELAFALQRGSGSRAASELIQALATVPTAANSPQGAANILSDIYVGQQRNIDMNNFYVRARDQLSNMGLNEIQLRHASQELANEFAQRQDANYGREREALRNIYMQEVEDPQTKQRIRLLPYIIQHADSMSPAFVRNIEERFGPGILRYFTGR